MFVRGDIMKSISHKQKENKADIKISVGSSYA